MNRRTHKHDSTRRTRTSKRGFVLPLVVVAMTILITLAVGAMMTSYGSRLQAARTKAETEAMLAAEAGYERAIFWMSQQTDILGALQSGAGSGAISFGTSTCSYDITFADYLGARPVFNVNVSGVSGRPTFTRVVSVDVMQETSGWAMGACRVPTGTTSTTGVYFKDTEVIDMPLHINNRKDSPDSRDIFIEGTPEFLRKVEMGEPRKTSGGTDKYSTVMTCFEDGIYFDQPDVRITDEAAVLSKINRFRDSTATSPVSFQFTPTASTSVSTPRYAAIQLEFFVEGGVGKVRITNNCTVKGISTGSVGPYDYSVVPGTGCSTFQKYSIYAYHFKSNTTSTIVTYPIEDTYVTQSFGGYESDPGGQIYVNGSVVIGSCDYEDMVVKGKITVVASGNIWIADAIRVDGDHDANGMPTPDNPNVLGLIAQGVIKIVDPGRFSAGTATGCTLVRVCNGLCSSNTRTLPDPMIVEAAITVGGGGFGAEYVGGGSSGRKENGGSSDDLYVRGSLTEVIRGVVNLGDPVSDGYAKNYYIDTRLMTGILPGDIWFSGKYIPAPAGWHDFRP